MLVLLVVLFWLLLKFFWESEGVLVKLWEGIGLKTFVFSLLLSFRVEVVVVVVVIVVAVVVVVIKVDDVIDVLVMLL